jgi:hypothetical protein
MRNNKDSKSIEIIIIFALIPFLPPTYPFFNRKIPMIPKLYSSFCPIGSGLAMVSWGIFPPLGCLSPRILDLIAPGAS